MLNLHKIRIKNVFISIHMIMFSFRHKGIGAHTLTSISINANYMCKSPSPSALRWKSSEGFPNLYLYCFWLWRNSKCGSWSYIFKLSRDKLHLKQQTEMLFIPVKHSVLVGWSIQSQKLERFLRLPTRNSGNQPSPKSYHSCSHSSRGCSWVWLARRNIFLSMPVRAWKTA